MLWLTLFSFVHTQSKGSALDSEAGRQLTFRPRWFLSLPPAGKQLPLVLSCFWASGSPWLTPPSIADLVSPWNPSVELRGLCGTFPCYHVTPWMWTVLPLFFFKKILFVDNFIYTHSTFSTSFKWHFCSNVTSSERLALSSPWYYNIMLIMVYNVH